MPFLATAVAAAAAAAASAGGPVARAETCSFAAAGLRSELHGRYSSCRASAAQDDDETHPLLERSSDYEQHARTPSHTHARVRARTHGDQSTNELLWLIAESPLSLS